MLVLIISQKVEDFKEAAAEAGALTVSELILESLIGQLTPGFISAITAYRQKRYERNVNQVLEILSKDIQEIKYLLAKYEDQNFIEEMLLPVLFDNAIDEIEVEKISYIVKGFETSLRENLTDQDLILMYYDILRQIRIKDLSILLNLYHRGPIANNIQDDSNPGIQSLYRIKHLKSLGLIIVGEPFTFGGFGEDEYLGVREGDLNLSSLGYGFLNFFVAMGRIDQYNK